MPNKQKTDVPKPIRKYGEDCDKISLGPWSLKNPSITKKLSPKRQAEFIKKIDEYVKIREDEPLAAIIKRMYNGLCNYPNRHTIRLQALRKISEKVHRMIEDETYEQAKLDLRENEEAKIKIPEGKFERLDFEKLAEPISGDRGKVRAILSKLRKVAGDIEEEQSHGLWYSIKFMFSEIEKYVLEELNIKEFPDEFVVEPESKNLAPMKSEINNANDINDDSLDGEYTIDLEKIAQMLHDNAKSSCQKISCKKTKTKNHKNQKNASKVRSRKKRT